MTAVQSDINTVAYIMKRRYADKQSADVTMREHPSYWGITKNSPIDGQDYAYATTTGNPQGISALFSVAQANAETLKGEQFVATPRLKYGVAVLDGPSMMRARGNKGSFYDLVTRTLDGVLEEMGANLAFDLQRDGVGLRGTIQTITAGVVISLPNNVSITGYALTLTNQSDVENFRRGMSLVGSQNATGSPLRAGQCKVYGLVRAAKQVIVDDIVAANLQAGDSLFRLGDPGNCMEGMGASTPLTTPTRGVLFRNVERNNDLEALAGSRLLATDRYPEEALGDLAVQISIIGKKVKKAKIYPTGFQAMVKRLGAKVIYNSPGNAADIGFESIMVHTAAGSIEVGSDPDCVDGVIRAWRDDAHEIRTIDEIVHVIRDDQNKAIRTANADGLEIRWRHLGNYIQTDQSPHGVASYMR